MKAILSSWARGGRPNEQSPFASPDTDVITSPLAARRNSLEERRRPAAGFNGDDRITMLGDSGKIDHSGAADESGDGKSDDGEDDQDENEDEHEHDEGSPLLPIFSAAHLGQ